MLTVEDPTENKTNEAQKHQKETENLLTQFPNQPFKNDFIEGMKIRGRERPIKEVLTDIKGRLR
jgi:hypothetical protein